MSGTPGANSEVTVVQRVARLPLVRSTLQAVTAAYADAKGRLPLLRWVGGVAELGVRGLSEVAARSASPLLDRLEPQITLANIYASMGIDELERRFPVLSQTADEVMGHLTDALFLTLDDLQMRVTDDIGAAAESATWLLEGTREAVVTQLDSVRRSALGGAVASGLDELLSRSEEAALFYLPLNERWSQELELRMQMFEDDDEEEEPAVLTRVVGLLLRVGLRSYQQALLLWDQVQHAVSTLRDLADLIGLTLVAEAVSGLAQMLLTLYVAGIYRLQSLQTLARRRASELALRLAALRPVSLALSLPERARASLAVVVTDLQELGKILVQLLINTTPLYNMLKEQADQLGANRLSLEELSDGGSSRRGSCDLVLSKASEGRLARRRRQAYLEARSRRGSKQDRLPPAQPEQEPIPAATPRRRSSSTEVFLAPIIQLVSQGQRAFEYLSPGPAPVPPAVEVANQVAETAE
ncbi:perilipin 6 isoform X2 [Lepisosteus oculatus]|uniref:perilipin 6 isoform X2 n=1 Tax=Lepisosteus oculatus TaxID=7918 RepID=UPI0037120B02